MLKDAKLAKPHTSTLFSALIIFICDCPRIVIELLS